MRYRLISLHFDLEQSPLLSLRCESRVPLWVPEADWRVAPSMGVEWRLTNPIARPINALNPHIELRINLPLHHPHIKGFVWVDLGSFVKATMKLT